jgi:hypothetical protein
MGEVLCKLMPWFEQGSVAVTHISLALVIIDRYHNLYKQYHNVYRYRGIVLHTLSPWQVRDALIACCVQWTLVGIACAPLIAIYEVDVPECLFGI